MGSKWLLRTWVTFLMAREQGEGCRLHVPGVSGECGERNVCPSLPSSSRMWRNWCGSIGEASGWSRARSTCPGEERSKELDLFSLVKRRLLSVLGP